jgi:hypothetical protein
MLKAGLKHEDVAKVIFALSLACNIKKIFDIPYGEVCNRLERAYSQIGGTQLLELR